MNRIIFIAVSLVLSIVGAVAQTPNQSGMVPNSPSFASPFISTGGVTASSSANRWGHNLNVVDDGGVDNTGATDVSATFQAVISAAAAANSAVYVPCGTYLVNSVTLTLPSNTKLFGAGACAIIKQGASLVANAAFVALYGGTGRLVLANSNFTSGNSNIVVEDLAFDTTLSSGAVSHAVFFYKGTNIQVSRVFVTGNGVASNDGVAFVASNDAQVRDSRVVNVSNACYDTWEGSDSISIVDNYCDNQSVTNAYGILATGMNTANAPATTTKIRIIGNTIKNTGQSGIWVQGGWNQVSGGGALYGSISDVVVAGNTIDTVTTFHGIRVSDALRVSISSNTIRTVQKNAVNVQSENLGTQSDVSIIGNVISGCNVVVGANPCILFSTTTTNSQFVGNRISGAVQNYDVQIVAGSSNVIIADNSMDTGSSGRILDSGTLDQIIDTGGSSAVGVLKAALGPYYTFTNTANSRSANFGVVDSFNAVIDAGAGGDVKFNLNTVNYVDIGNASIALKLAPVVISATTDASASSGSGSLQVAGGASIAKRFWIPAITASAGLQTAVLCQSSGGEMIADSVACLASGYQFKKILGPVEAGALAKLVKLPIDRWEYKAEGQFTSADWTRERIGPIAQDVAAMDPRLAGYDKDGNIRTFSPDQLLAFTIKAVQEHVDKTETEYNELRACNDNWKCRLFGIR